MASPAETRAAAAQYREARAAWRGRPRGERGARGPGPTGGARVIPTVTAGEATKGKRKMKLVNFFFSCGCSDGPGPGHEQSSATTIHRSSCCCTFCTSTPRSHRVVLTRQSLFVDRLLFFLLFPSVCTCFCFVVILIF